MWATVAAAILILVTGFFALRPLLYPIVEAKTGIIEVRVTDAPPEYGITEIWVTVLDSEEEGVAVHKAGDDGDGVWITIPITGDNPFELLSLQKADLDALLATEEVTVGKYTQIRMTIDIVQVKIGDGDLQPAVLPSGKLKFVRPFEVFDGETTIILLDFDADKSVTVTGGGKVIVKPVVKLSVSQALVIATTSLPDGEVGTEYTATVAAIGGTDSTSMITPLRIGLMFVARNVSGLISISPNGRGPVSLSQSATAMTTFPRARPPSRYRRTSGT